MSSLTYLILYSLNRASCLAPDYCIVLFLYSTFGGEKNAVCIVHLSIFADIVLPGRQWLACRPITKNVVHGFIKV